MINLIEDATNQIKKVINNAINKVSSTMDIPDIHIEEIEIEIPRDKHHGDFSTNIAMQLARQFKKPPVAIAQELIDSMQLENTHIEKVEKAGPGFINFHLNPKWLYEVIFAVEKYGDDYGKTNIGKGQK